MARTPSGDRMGACSQPSPFIPPTYPLSTMPSSGLALNPSFAGQNSLKTHLNTAESSSSTNASAPFSLPLNADVTATEACAPHATHQVLGPTPGVFSPNSNSSIVTSYYSVVLGGTPYGHGSFVLVNQSLNRSRLMAPLSSNVYPHRIVSWSAPPTTIEP